MRNDKPAKVPLLKDLKANRDLYLMMLPFFLLFFLMILLPVLVGRGAALVRKSTRLNSSHMSESRMPLYAVKIK